jgi:hypothetical protein
MRWRENGGSCTMRNFIICTHPQISLGKSSQGEWGGRDMWHAGERRQKCTRFWWESPKERDHWEDQGEGGKTGLEWTLGRLAWGGGWSRLAQDRDRWRAVVSAVMNLLIHAVSHLFTFCYHGVTRCVLLLQPPAEINSLGLHVRCGAKTEIPSDARIYDSLPEPCSQFPP